MAKSEEDVVGHPEGRSPSGLPALPSGKPASRKYRMCCKCGAAENPKSNLAFTSVDEGGICARCYERHYAAPGEGRERKSAPRPEDIRPTFQGNLVLIDCPHCAFGHKRAGCKTCMGYGSVRVQENALPIYRMPMKAPPMLLTEEGEADKVDEEEASPFA